jgi:hypothetical protein
LEDIPAATQLFTPNWIVKYLVQNSVGRKWLQTYPDSTIKSAMEYYIEPAEQTAEVNAQLKAITPDSIEPESIKVLDPACGSGHILVEAYNVLKAIYEERGYQTRKIPQLILENNLFGLDIDDRAAQLAGFTLMMLARNDDRRIFTRDVKLNVLSLQETAHTDITQLWREVDITDNDQSKMVQDIWTRFEHAKTFGSLIDIPTKYEPSLKALLSKLTDIEQTGSFLQRPAAEDLKPIIQQAWLLAQRYDAVVANPPYMGGNKLCSLLKAYLKNHYNGFDSDLFSSFILNCNRLIKSSGYIGLMTPIVWMYLSSHKIVREYLIENKFISSLIELPPGGFKGATVQIAAFCLEKAVSRQAKGKFIRLEQFRGSDDEFALKTLTAISSEDCDWMYESNQYEWINIPGSPVAYWLNSSQMKPFKDKYLVDAIATPLRGVETGDNEKFIKHWHEVDVRNIGINQKKSSGDFKWYPYNKGGEYCKWYGNKNLVVNWRNDGEDIKNQNYPKGSRLPWRAANSDKYFVDGITWGGIGYISFRYCDYGAVFDSNKGSMMFPEPKDEKYLLGFLNSSVSSYYLRVLNPTVSTQKDDVGHLPMQKSLSSEIKLAITALVKKCILIAKRDEKYLEVNWDYHQSAGLIGKSLTQSEYNVDYDINDILAIIYEKWKHQNDVVIAEMQHLEEENNRLFIDVYDLRDELSPDVPPEKITLTVNPKYRYGGNLSDQALNNRFQSDTLAEHISYAIGCMMGRYSVDREGLVYAHAGNEGFNDLVKEGAYNTFPADDDGIIPLTDEEWFEDDITLRFREFIQTVWGKENLQANLDFVAESLRLHAVNAKSGETSLDTIRRYLSTQFYKDHLQTYKKRPIYWLFSSGKQKAFECLVYLHRYNESTLARMRTEYVSPLLGKYDAYAGTLSQQIEQATSTAEANRLSKSLTALEKKQTELREFDDKLKHHADMQIKLDLDDGVKVNYGKFGDLLVDVKGVTGKK